MMDLILLSSLLIVVVVFVAFPLLKAAEDGKGRINGNAEANEPPAIQREKFIAELKDVEMDYRMGKLSIHDYRQLRKRLEQKFAALYALSEDQK